MTNKQLGAYPKKDDLQPKQELICDGYPYTIFETDYKEPYSEYKRTEETHPVIMIPLYSG